MRRARPFAAVAQVAPVASCTPHAPRASFARTAPRWIETLAWRCAALALAGLLAVAGQSGVRAQERATSVASTVAPVRPSTADEPATAWLPTTDPNLTVLFSLSRDEEGCVVSCERYKFFLRYAEPAVGPTPTAQWVDASHTSCVDYWVDGRPDVACSTFGEMAGRDRHGRDYVLLQLYSSRAQLDRMRRAHGLIFQFGDNTFHLTAAGRSALERFLAESGGR